MRSRSSIIQRAYEAGIIFEIFIAPDDGFTLKVMYKQGFLVWRNLNTFNEVEYWLKATAKVNFDKVL